MELRHKELTDFALAFGVFEDKHSLKGEPPRRLRWGGSLATQNTIFVKLELVPKVNSHDLSEAQMEHVVYLDSVNPGVINQPGLPQ